MKNFIFISPNFPTNYWKFCAELKKNGMNVLGIGDCPYDDLMPELRGSLSEYFKVSSLENYEEVFRAVAFLTYRHGKIDWLESNNEYWLERDAALRTAFHITTGFQESDMPSVKYKSLMKEKYALAGIPTAPWHIVDDEAGCRAFIESVGGYPVIVKPDNGVGASHTYKLKSDADLSAFLADHEPVPYIMEQFVCGTVHSYDAIIDGEGHPLFETGNVTIDSIMDIVNTNGNSCYYIEKSLPDAMREAGRKTVAAFGVKSRFIHFEFFVLDEDQPLGKKGDILGLEVNMRPSGGFSADMFNFANSIDVYKIWADMVAFGKTDLRQEGREHFYCCYCGRRDGKDFVMDHDAIMQKYGDRIKMVQRIPKALSGAMADMMYLVNVSTPEEKDTYYRDLLEVH
ncbi:MAG: ATP-grasp domain-containing protein [Clostridia bacterium]|nr:ATP-grasp domain-containing protein [Clostridia bacterium]